MINFYLFLLGLAVGSFLNVLIDRLPKGESINGRSRCDHCKKKLTGWDLIPVLSFIILRGRCRYCKHKLSFYYPLVELITGLSFILIFNYQISPLRPLGFEGQAISQFLNLLISLGLFSCLIVIFFSDLKYQIIPDSMQVAFFIFSLLLKSAEIFQKKCVGGGLLHCYIATLLPWLFSGVVVMLPILFLWWVTRGRGMGFGDVKLAFSIGFLLGLKDGILSLYLAFILGAVVGLVLIILKKKKLKSKIAFGPFLVLGMILLFFARSQIWSLIYLIYRY